MRADPIRPAVPSETGSKPRESGRATAIRIGSLFAATVTVAEVGILLSGRVAIDASLLVYVGVQGTIIGLVALATRLEHRSLREYGFVMRGPVNTSLLFSCVLVIAFLLVEFYPGFLVGFGRVPAPDVLGFGFLLFSAPLVAVSQEATFRGYIFRKLTRGAPLTWAMGISAGLFAAQTTNFAILPALGEVAGGEYLFGTTIANFVLGLLLALYFYKARWSLLGPVATRTGMLWVATLMPVAANFSNWEASFAALLLAYGILFVIIAFGLREPRLQAHHYLGEPIGPRRLRFRERTQNRRQVRDAVLAVGVIAVVGLGATQVGPIVLGTSSPLLAIASGSMVPTLHRGDLVIVEHASPGSIAIGTIIAFHVSCLPAPTVHRVYRIVQIGSSPVYQTKGDANPSPDPCLVPYQDVIGKVVATVPYAGYSMLDPLLDAAVVALIVVAALLVPTNGGLRHR